MCLVVEMSMKHHSRRYHGLHRELMESREIIAGRINDRITEMPVANTQESDEKVVQIKCEDRDRIEQMFASKNAELDDFMESTQKRKKTAPAYEPTWTPFAQFQKCGAQELTAKGIPQ